MFYKKYQQRLRLNNNMSITILHKKRKCMKKKKGSRGRRQEPITGEDSYSKYRHTLSQKKNSRREPYSLV